MKKMAICLTIGMLAAVCLNGCGAEKGSTGHQTGQEQYVAGEAVETAVTEVSEEERQKQRKEKQKEAEQIRREIEERYAMYEPFGLSYDAERDLFFYKGETVRYFKDAISISETNGFFYDSGVVDLTAKRDEKGELTELVKASPEEFDARTKKHEERETEFGNAVGEATYACEEGDPQQKDSTLDAYKAYGIEHDDRKMCWIFQGEPVKFFYDEGHSILQDGSVPDGINVKVIRDDKDNIETISEMTDEEMKEIMK